MQRQICENVFRSREKRERALPDAFPRRGKRACRRIPNVSPKMGIGWGYGDTFSYESSRRRRGGWEGRKWEWKGVTPSVEPVGDHSPENLVLYPSPSPTFPSPAPIVSPYPQTILRWPPRLEHWGARFLGGDKGGDHYGNSAHKRQFFSTLA